MFDHIVFNIHSEFWLESQARARTLTDLRDPPMSSDYATVLLLLGDTGSCRRRNVYR